MSAINNDLDLNDRIVSNKQKFLIISLYAVSQIIFGISIDSPRNIVNGLYSILTQPDTLITDYIGLGGMGAAFINSGLLTLIFIFLLYKLKININGVSIASLFLIEGFALFGKNLLNVWFIVIGVYLYSKVQRDKFSKYIYIALFGTAMAPMTSEIMFNTSLVGVVRIPLGIVVGVVIGFILPPLSTYLLRVHQGFNLYNIGFTAGMIGTVFVSIFKSYGFLPNPRFIWTTGNDRILGIYLIIMFISMIGIGYYIDKDAFKKLKDIFKYPGRLVADFVMLEGFGPTLVNMGLNGIIALAYLMLIKGDLNGPTIGGIFTIVGFGALGKHAKNIFPIFIGVFLGSITKIWMINDPAIQLAALFGTALAPIAGEFGWFYGIVAAFIHSSVVLNVGVLHGGLNLYNNGFAAGIVAAIIVPIIEAFRKDEY